MGKTILAVVLLALGFACGGSNSTFATGTAAVAGTFAGQTMTARDAISAVVTINSQQSEAVIILSNVANQCNRINARQANRNGQALAFTLGIQTGSTIAPPTATTYPILTLSAGASAQGPVAAAQFLTTDASCAPLSQTEGTGGNVVVTSVTATGYTGTFDVTFSAADHLTGSFTTATCTPIISASPATSCGP